MKRKRY